MNEPATQQLMPRQPMTVFVGTDGLLKFIYDDELLPLLALGQATVQRASHVEPAAQGGWTADLRPSQGPVLGPFRQHREAITSELAWIQEQMANGTFVNSNYVG